MARKQSDIWAGFKTTGESGWHFTGEDDKCPVNFLLFTCDHSSHSKEEQEYKRRGRRKIKKEINHLD